VAGFVNEGKSQEEAVAIGANGDLRTTLWVGFYLLWVSRFSFLARVGLIAATAPVMAMPPGMR